MGVTKAVRIRGRSPGVAPLIPPAIFVAGVAIGWASLAQSELLGSGGWIEPQPASFSELFWPILGRNLGAALLLFSGACTAGFSTVLALGLVSAYIGATFGAAASNVGVADALGSVIVYAPIEFAGLLLAATAGVMPVVALVRNAFSDDAHGSLTSSYIDALRPAITWLMYSVVLIVLGAAVESAVIAGR